MEKEFVSKIKDMFNFEKVEINKESILFEKSLSMFRCEFKEKTLVVLAIAIGEKIKFDNVIKLLEEICSFKSNKKYYLREFELVGFSTLPDKEKVSKLFTNCGEYNIGEISTANLGFVTHVDNKDLEINLSLKEDNSCIMTVTLSTQIQLSTGENPLEIFEDNKNYLAKKINDFLSNRV
jgi:hypothetical protein